MFNDTNWDTHTGKTAGFKEQLAGEGWSCCFNKRLFFSSSSASFTQKLRRKYGELQYTHLPQFPIFNTMHLCGVFVAIDEPILKHYY